MKEMTIRYILLPILSFLVFHLSNGQPTTDLNYSEVEVSEYQVPDEPHTVALKMAYAQHQIYNPEVWDAISAHAEVLAIDLVFTKYPRKKRDWITDYDFLLNARIKNLMALIPSLKDNPLVTWQFVLQNKCIKEPEAEAMFHGAVVHYKNTEKLLITASLDSQEIIKETEKAPLPPIKLETKPPTPTDGEKYRYMGFYDVDKMLKGKLPIKDSLIFHIFNRNPQWKKMLVVNDWTASMYVYGTQAVMWQKENLSEDKICHFVFFNDGNRKHNDKKIPGKTGGIYSVKASDMDKVIKTMRKVMAKGQGGDREENDIEALKYAMNRYSGAKEVILIADNKSEIRDIDLVKELNKPVRIIICGTSKLAAVHEDYISLAMETKGTLHTLTADYNNLHKLSEGETVFIEDVKYKLENHQLVMISNILD